MSTLKGIIELRITDLNYVIRQANEKLSEDYIGAFRGNGTLLNIYNAWRERKDLTELLKLLNERPSYAVAILQINIQALTQEALQGELTSNSTNQFENIAYTAERQMNLFLLKTMKEYLDLITREVYPVAVM